MPELPEVETTARDLRRLVLGQSVIGLSGVDWPRMLPNASADCMAQAVTGDTLMAVERRGKYLVLRLNHAVLLLHRKMSGNVFVVPSDTTVEIHTHWILHLADGQDVRFVDARKFGRIYLFTEPKALEEFLTQRLGPEPLSDLTPRLLRERLAGRRARIKSLLLDQRVIAGLGNLYLDEALWEARVHPERSAASLTGAEVARLALAVRTVLEQGIERRGTSFNSYRDAEGRPGTNQDGLKAYGRGPLRGRAAQPCLRCGRDLQRLTFGQRGSVYCPGCQKPPRLARRPRVQQ